MLNELAAILQRLTAYIESAYHLSDPRLVRLRRELLEQPEVLCHDPFLESTARYRIGREYQELSIPPEAKELLSYLASDACGTVVFPRPYEHQAQALEALLAEDLRHAIVTTGTGSGKTETFLMPIMGRLAREAVRSRNSFKMRAVRTLMLYPMNALVNDQLSRLRRLFAASATREWFVRHGGRPIKFGRYTSRTPFPGVIPQDTGKLSEKLSGMKFYVDLEKNAAAGKDHAGVELLRAMRNLGKWPAKEGGLASWLGTGGPWRDPSGKLRRAVEHPNDSELLARHEMQTAAPDLLITNYSMLEYMMLRPIERSIFSCTREYFSANPHERFLLVLDEAHLYRGAQGTEVAMLIRRLRHRLELPASQFQVVLTSASFEDPESAKRFAAGLSGTEYERFVSIPGQRVSKVPSCAGTVEEANALAAVDLKSLLSDDAQERFRAIVPLLGLSAGLPLAEYYEIQTESTAPSTGKREVIITGLSSDGELQTENLEMAVGGTYVTRRSYVTIVEIESSDPTATTSARRKNGNVECVRNAEDARAVARNHSQFGMSRVLHELLSDLGVTGRLINLTSRTEAATDPETQRELGAQQICRLALRLFPDVPAALAEAATDVLVEAASMARKTPDGMPLLAARVHRFFRGLPGIWACSDPDCGAAPQDGHGMKLTGKLYAQPRRTCDCGARTFELLACRNCGTAMFQAYAQSAKHPDYLWSENVGEIDDNLELVVPIHLCLEDPEVCESNDSSSRSRLMHLESLTGKLYEYQPESMRIRDVFLPPDVDGDSGDAGLFKACPKCRDRRAEISDMATKGDEPFQHLVAAQLMSQPPIPGNSDALQGRKLLVFSDGRQPASRLAGKLKSNSMRDAVRPLLIHGLRYAANRWFDGHTRNVPIEHAYLALLCGALVKGVELRPQLKENERTYQQDVDAAEEIFKLEAVDRAGFEETSRMLSERTPTDILVSLYEVLFNSLSGFQKLGLGRFTPLLTPLVEQRLSALIAPSEPRSIASESGRRNALLEFWMQRMAREHAVILPGTPNEWIGSYESRVRLRFNSGKFEALMKTRFGNAFYRDHLAGGKHGPGPWLRFFQDQLGSRGCVDGFLARPQRLALDLDYQAWVRCSVCTATMPKQPFSKDACPDCDSLGSLRDLSDDTSELHQVFLTRMGFFRKDIDDDAADLRPFVAEEHTAAIGAIDAADAFSRAEWHEMRFQNLDLLGPGGERGGIVDVLSCTTTMEVGIDIGSLTAVALRNVPPNRANYQQRAGRAGRRGSSLSTVITYADQGSHDQRYFRQPAEMIAGPVTDPVLNLENVDIVRRHGYALILGMFQRDRLASLEHSEATANLFSSLGLVETFRTGEESDFSFRGLRSWLESHRGEVNEALRSILPDECRTSSSAEAPEDISRRLLERLREIGCDELTGQPIVAGVMNRPAVWEGGEERDRRQAAGDAVQGDDSNSDVAESPTAARRTDFLLDRLFETATLPSYAFPTDVVSMTVFDKNRSTGFRNVIKYAPQRGLAQALSNYAPGREVFIDGKRHYSFALYHPIRQERQRAWDERKLYFECERCGYAKLEEIGDIYIEGQVVDCPSCRKAGGMGPAIYWLVPPGFAHPVDLDEELAVDQPPDFTRPTQAKLNAPFRREDEPGRTLLYGDRGFTIWTKKEELFLTNRGSEELRNRGFIYCLKCGRIEPKGWHDQERSYLNNHAAHPKPYPAARDKTQCQGYTKTVGLGTKFVSDVSLFRFQLGDDVRLAPGKILTKLCLTTVAQALALVASDKLEIERANLGAEFRVAQTERGSIGAEVDVYLYDTTPGGAGFVKAAVADPEALLLSAVKLLDDCDCESSCYRCLRSYDNRFLHQDLDRELGSAFLKHILGLEPHPTLDGRTIGRLLRVLAVDLRDSGAIVDEQGNSLLIGSSGDQRVVLSHALSPDRPVSVDSSSSAAHDLRIPVIVDHLLVKRALLAATVRCSNPRGSSSDNATPLPAGLRSGNSGLRLTSLRLIGDAEHHESSRSTDLRIPGHDQDQTFLLEIDGRQFENEMLVLNGEKIPIRPGTVLALLRLDEPATQTNCDGRPLLIRSSAHAFKATGTKTTFARSSWRIIDEKPTVQLSYRTLDSHTVPQNVDPANITIIGTPLGVIREGVFIPVSIGSENHAS